MQAAGSFRFSNTTLAIGTLFEIRPLENIPNRRSGIILGQLGLIDRMHYESIPKSILEWRGEIVGENEWGDLDLKTYLDDDGQMIEIKGR